MISHQYKCIYIHIPKTAGTSIEYKLGHFKERKRGVQDHSTLRDVEPISLLETAKLLLRGELKVVYRRIKRRMSSHDRISQKRFNEYFKFTFVRNPWSRVFSWYQNVMRDDIHRRSLGVPSPCSFEEFLKNHAGQWALKPQLYWITNTRGKVPLDFIGRYESLEKDFSHVCEILGLKDKSLPKLLSGNNPPYTQFYNPEMKDRVARFYAEEIRIFRFEFGE